MARAEAVWWGDFLAALAEGNSVRGAARVAGVDHSSAYYARKRDAGFAGRWAAAVAEGRGRLARGERPALARDEIVRHSKHGRPCVMRVGPGRWSAAKEATFLTALEEGANVKRAADAIGMSTETLYARRRREPAFFAAWAEAVRGGYLDVEALLIEHAKAVLSGAEPCHGGALASDGRRLIGAMSVADAINILKLHRSTVKGGVPQRYNWRAKEPDMEEVTAEILRKVAAMERAEARRSREP